MRIYHPLHGILFATDQTEIDRLISTGGAEFDVNEKPWINKNEIKETTKTNEANEEAEVLNTPRRGRPKLNGNN